MPFWHSDPETTRAQNYFSSPAAAPTGIRATTEAGSIEMASEETNTTAGILRAIEWLRQLGRPVLAAKMKRELLRVDFFLLRNFRII
jgi:hypothetical protein